MTRQILGFCQRLSSCVRRAIIASLKTCETSKIGNIAGRVWVSHGLDAISDELSCLQGKAHSCKQSPNAHECCVIAQTFSAHGNRIRNSTDKSQSSSQDSEMGGTDTVPYCHPSIPCFDTASFTIFPRSCTKDKRQ